MLKLYYAKGACSLSPHIVLHEAGIEHQAEPVNLKEHTLVRTGGDYYLVNPKGAVPALALDDGRVLTEGSAIVQFIADQAPDRGLAPANGSFERYELQAWLSYIGTEIHKQFGPIFKGGSEQDQQRARDTISKSLTYVESQLDEHETDYLCGDDFTVADAYLFTMLRWCRNSSIDFAAMPCLTDYYARVEQRPSVQAAIKMEDQNGVH